MLVSFILFLVLFIIFVRWYSSRKINSMIREMEEINEGLSSYVNLKEDVNDINEWIEVSQNQITRSERIPPLVPREK